MIFTLPNLPDGRECRLASDKYQWRIEVYRKVTGDTFKWDAIKFCSTPAAAAQAYMDYAVRLSPIEDDLKAAGNFVDELAGAVTVSLGHIGIQVSAR